jgi:beta-glucosidase
MFLLFTGVFAAAQTEATTEGSKAFSAKVDSLVKQMTLEEKIDYIGGTGFAVRAVPRLGLPALEMSDGPYGVRSNEKLPSTVYAAGIGLAATWNPDLALKVGQGIGRDARARGIHFMLSPGVNIYRAPMNGRNFEYFGEDPFLASQIAKGYIEGIQQYKVSATIKHFAANNSEFDRHNVDSIVDERTLREIYLPTFETAVKEAHVGAIMDSYNLINGAHATQIAHLNVDIVKKEWGFPGIIMSDWSSTYDGVAAANNGLDLEMPTGAFMNRKNLLPAVQSGQVKETTIDDKVRRILNTAERFGWLDHEQTDVSLSKYSAENRQVALQSAREAMVLLKNTGDLLPLNKSTVKTILVVGPDAYPAQAVGGGSARAIPYNPVSVLEGISNAAGKTANVLYDRGLPTMTEFARSTEFKTEANGGERGLKMESFRNPDLSGEPAGTSTVEHIDTAGFSWEDVGVNPELSQTMFETMSKGASRRWTGYYMAPETGKYVLAVQGSGEGGGHRVLVDEKVVVDNWKQARALQPHVTLQLSAGPHKIVAEEYQSWVMGGRLRVGIAPEDKLVTENAKKMAAKADVVIVAAGFDPESESEGADRTFQLPFGQEELIRAMADANKNVVVALTSGGNVDPSGWLGRVPAYIAMWYPGQEGGTALAEILFGEVNPSGRLPVTFEQHWEDNPVAGSYYPEPGSKKVEYNEGIFVGYRGYEHNQTKPLFPFGYGLSYTTFKFSNLLVQPRAAAKAAGSAAAPGEEFTVSFDLTNTGKRAGAEVAQVYVSDTHAPSNLPRPPKELKGFAKVMLKPGETRHVSVNLGPRAFAYYDEQAKAWKVDPGTFNVLVGSSSAQIELTGKAEVK